MGNYNLRLLDVYNNKSTADKFAYQLSAYAIVDLGEIQDIYRSKNRGIRLTVGAFESDGLSRCVYYDVELLEYGPISGSVTTYPTLGDIVLLFSPRNSMDNLRNPMTSGVIKYSKNGMKALLVRSARLDGRGLIITQDSISLTNGDTGFTLSNGILSYSSDAISISSGSDSLIIEDKIRDRCYKLDHSYSDTEGEYNVYMSDMRMYPLESGEGNFILDWETEYKQVHTRRHWKLPYEDIPELDPPVEDEKDLFYRYIKERDMVTDLVTETWKDDEAHIIEVRHSDPLLRTWDRTVYSKADNEPGDEWLWEEKHPLIKESYDEEYTYNKQLINEDKALVKDTTEKLDGSTVTLWYSLEDNEPNDDGVWEDLKPILTEEYTPDSGYTKKRTDKDENELVVWTETPDGELSLDVKNPDGVSIVDLKIHQDATMTLKMIDEAISVEVADDGAYTVTFTGKIEKSYGDEVNRTYDAAVTDTYGDAFTQDITGALEISSAGFKVDAGSSDIELKTTGSVKIEGTGGVQVSGTGGIKLEGAAGKVEIT